MESKPLKSVAFLCNASARWQAELPSVLNRIETFPAFDKKIFRVDRSRSDSTETLISEILSGPFDALAVVGGDGTLNRTVNALAQKNALEHFPLAVIPFGTCNDFAKTLGLRAGDLGGALTALERGRTREIRVGRVNRHCFLNNAGFGRRSPGDKKTGALASLRAMRPVHVRVREPLEARGDFYMMICANAPYFSNGLHFDATSDPGDGTLDFFFVRATGKWGLFWRLASGRRGCALHRGADDPLVFKISAETLQMESDEPLWIMADGEVVPDLSAVREARFSTEGACRFVVA